MSLAKAISQPWAGEAFTIKLWFYILIMPATEENEAQTALWIQFTPQELK